MIQKIVDIINSTTHKFESGTLFCYNYNIVDIDTIEFLESNNVLENILNTKQIGATIDLELSLAHLNSIGFYEDCETFILKNKYRLKSESYYIDDIKCFGSESNEFILKYISVINLIDSIKKIAKHTYTDTDIENSIIVKEDRSAFIPFKYNAFNIKSINIRDIDKLNSISIVFNDTNNEKKLLFINEFIDFVNLKEENLKFIFLLGHFNEFVDQCENAYQYYLRDFSYNKLKIELDSKAFEFTQKIQSVINESQTKLIAIPTAFVLAFASFDFIDIFILKNIVILISLVIFAILIQLFLNNQKSSLNFIRDNIDTYKNTFKEDNIEKISDKFYLVEVEFKKQKNRLRIIEFILWLIPLSLLCLWLFLIDLHVISITLISLFVVIIALQGLFM